MIRRLPAALAALAGLSGCAGGAEPRQAAGREAPAIASTTSRLHFRYSYPAEAAAIPELAALLRREGLARLAEARRDSANGRGRRDGPDKVEQAWELIADTPGLIALSAVASTWQDGSAHGYFGYRRLIWGKSRRRPLKLEELFSDRRGVAQLMSKLCARLNSERTERRHEPTGRRLDRSGGQVTPMACPNADEATIVPVGREGRIIAFRMMLTGDETPEGYAGGAYEVEAPVTPELAALLDPVLRGSF